MLPLLNVQKVSEQYRDYIVTSGFMCSFTNYFHFLKSKEDRQCIVKEVQITEDIAGKLIVYPTGIDKTFEDFISIYVEARWNKSKTIVIKLDIAMLDICGKRKALVSSENFRKIRYNTTIGEPEVAHAKFLQKNHLRFINGGCLNILVNISVHIGMMIHPEMLDRFQEEYRELEAKVKKCLTDPSYGDAVLTVRGENFYVDRKILMAGNPMFVNVFAGNSSEKDVYQFDFNPEVILHILLDCYLNGGEDDAGKEKDATIVRV